MFTSSSIHLLSWFLFHLQGFFIFYYELPDWFGNLQGLIYIPQCIVGIFPFLFFRERWISRKSGHKKYTHHHAWVTQKQWSACIKLCVGIHRWIYIAKSQGNRIHQPLDLLEINKGMCLSGPGNIFSPLDSLFCCWFNFSISESIWDESSSWNRGRKKKVQSYVSDSYSSIWIFGKYFIIEFTVIIPDCTTLRRSNGFLKGSLAGNNIQVAM